MTARLDISTRLENWSRWATARGARGADCMTGAICESLRKAALGNVWSGHTVYEDTNELDAMAIQRAMGQIALQQRLLLHWCYIEQARPEVVCRMVSLPVKPISVFVDALLAAKDAIEDATDGNNR